MNKAIVTGANGFVGVNLIEELLSKNFIVYAIINNNRDIICQKLPNDNLIILTCNLSEIEKLINLIDDRSINYFFHLAWEGSSGAARIDYDLQLKNVSYTLNALQVAKLLGCTKFIGAGSVMELEIHETVWQNGSTPSLPFIYGAAKYMAHSLSKIVANNLGIEHVWGLITNTYGPGERSARFLNSTIRKSIKNEILQFTSATQNYDFVFISDIAKLFYNLAINGKNNSYYVLGSGNAKPLKEYILEIVDALSIYQPIHFGDIPFTGVNLPLSFFSTKESEKDLGYSPAIAFKEGIKLTRDWIQLND